MNPAPNLFFIGPMGAGKSTLGKRVAEALGLPFFDLDHEIQEHCGADIPLIFDIEGEAGFRRRESATLAEFAAREGIVLATGGGAILDADNRRALRERGFVVYLETTVDEQLERLARDRKRPLLAAPDRRERLLALAAQRDPLYREIANLTLPAGHRGSAAAIAQRLAATIAQTWQRAAAGKAA
ncbi:MAG: shikimate kinase [Xanthomonadaceae bacterium]|nr:shikimate kinase [Xanthomonadaceae bacterium]MDE1962212.1 shikimate kinase [Xanthomonadaceae bacterium]MDE2085402.1 shikimate kinase [Xanthomonadaceae bacterium]MDE2257709.1 shikimate kinase [Xanthomonadaceae bacterium]